MKVKDLLKHLIDWFFGKAPPKLKTLEEEIIHGEGISIIRYQRRTHRAYRTWRVTYKEFDYDLILGWDTLAYLPDVPVLHKRDRLSTHLVSIYKQGLHARYNPIRRCHEPDITVLVSDEVCLESTFMSETVRRWRDTTRTSDKPIQTDEDLFNRIIDEVARYAIRHPPAEIKPSQINWREVVQQTTRVFLGKEHQVFPATAIVEPLPIMTAVKST